MPAFKNSFRAPMFVEETIVDENNAIIGTIRIKPSSVLWAAKGAHKFHSVSIDKFAEWITSEDTVAKMVRK